MDVGGREPNMQRWTVSVKNTFITVEDPESPTVLPTLLRSLRRAKTEPQGACKARCHRANITVLPEECTALLARLEQEVADGVAAMRGSVRRLAFHPQGCRMVQEALDVASSSMRASMAEELQGAVRAAARSLYANFVLQRMIQVLPVRSVAFISRELAGNAVQTACHFTGCRVLRSLFERAVAADKDTARLSTEILLSDIPKLCRHRFGCHVAVAILEHGQSLHRGRIAHALRGGAERHARHRHAGLVLEALLTQCTHAECEALCKELLQSPARLASLAFHPIGGRVALAMANIAGLSTAMQSVLDTVIHPGLRHGRSRSGARRSRRTMSNRLLHGGSDA